MLNLKMKLFGLRRHNYVNSIRPVNLISVSILNTGGNYWKELLLYLRNADGEEVIRRVCKNVPTDFIAEPIHVKPIYDSGILNVYYVK